MRRIPVQGPRSASSTACSLPWGPGARGPGARAAPAPAVAKDLGLDALANEKETFTIYKTQLGDEHEKTKESGECLKHLTQQAVVLQKKMNDLYQGKTKAGLPPIQIQPPSMSSVLDMLNIINGK